MPNVGLRTNSLLTLLYGNFKGKHDFCKMIFCRYSVEVVVTANRYGTISKLVLNCEQKYVYKNCLLLQEDNEGVL